MSRAGETLKSRALCLDIRPWSKTSHIVVWLTPEGRVTTVVKGAVRPKSAFLGQYDLNYTCEIVYYARSKGDVHALRECSPLEFRENLRVSYRASLLAGYFRSLVMSLVPFGDESSKWMRFLEHSLDGLVDGHTVSTDAQYKIFLMGRLIHFEKGILDLCGLKPDFSGYDKTSQWSPFSVETGRFDDSGGRLMRVSKDVAEYIDRSDYASENLTIPLDAARVIGVFYQFHLDCASDVRRTVIKMIS